MYRPNVSAQCPRTTLAFVRLTHISELPNSKRIGYYAYLSQRFDHLVACHPVIVISSQPALRNVAFIIFLHMILISRKDPGAAIFEVDLHDAEAGCVSRRMAKIDSRCNLQKWSVKRLPVEIEAQILWQIDPMSLFVATE